MQNKIAKIITFIFSCLFICQISGLKAQMVDPELDMRLQYTLDSMRVKLNIKSLSGAIQIGESKYWKGAKGISSLNPYLEASADDVYLIGSVVKTMTSACILQLIDEGKLTLNDSIYEWLDTMPFIDGNITIRQLLRHQSGLYDFLSNPASQPTFLSQPDSVWTQEDLLKTFMKAPLAAPGGTWNYCNTNYLLLGMIIKKVTGHYFYEEYRSRFFNPLMMNSTAIPAFETITSNIAHVWIDLNGDGINDDAHDFYSNWLSLNSAASSAGGYYSTALETAIWMRSFIKGDLVSAPVMDEAFQTIPSPGLPGGTYGLGVMRKSFNGTLAYGHQGDLAYSASSWFFPSLDISITVLCNDSKINSHDLDIVISALQKKFREYTATVSSNNVEIQSIELFAYPIPFSDRINVRLRGINKLNKVDIHINDQLGVELKKFQNISLKDGENTFSLDLHDHWHNGIYFLTVVCDTKIVKTVSLFK